MEEFDAAATAAVYCPLAEANVHLTDGVCPLCGYIDGHPATTSPVWGDVVEWPEEFKATREQVAQGAVEALETAAAKLGFELPAILVVRAKTLLAFAFTAGAGNSEGL